jgi:mannose-6-phosphate isomerase
MEISEKIQKIQGVFKHYDWGGKTFLPALLHRSNEEKKPYAEYWLGSDLHDSAGRLPYLFKVQDVEKMLSIQVHPSKESAEAKYREENEKGIPADAPNRNFKDDNHKPELLSPLGDFYLLHGFKFQVRRSHYQDAKRNS